MPNQILMHPPLSLHTRLPATQGDLTPRYERSVVLAIVITLHLVLMTPFLLRTEQPRIAVNEMSVSVAIRRAAISQAQPDAPQVEPQPKPERTEPERNKPVIHELADAVAPSVLVADRLSTPATAVASADVPSTTTATATVADTEPDYKADYLNNPRPLYPAVARRWGWEGRVVLNVQVLAEGTCGSIVVLSSSGRESFDNAALQTVKGWRFIPARHAGHPVTKWFKVPINFSLQDKEI